MIADFVARMPKVELHVHLEGSIQPATLLALAARRGVDLPARDPAGLRRWFRFRDFNHFVEVYLLCSRCLREPEDFQLVVADFLREQARQNVLYTEAHFTISTHVARGLNRGEIADALAEALREGERREGVRLRLIPDIVRNVPVERADVTLEWAVGGRDKGVVALGLSGDESWPCEPFREHFAEAARSGLRRVAHAGEHGGSGSVRAALDVLGAERIGHGVRVAGDRELEERLCRERIPLEVCPTSNLRLGVVPDLTAHPFDAMRRAGLALSVNSDDPPLFDTTLCGEYEALAETFGYGPEELAGLALAGLEHSFLGASEKERWRQEWRARCAALGEELFGRAVVPTFP